METMFFFEKAQDGDKDEVMQLLNAARENMKENGLDQWDEIYPAISDVAKDIKEETGKQASSGSSIIS